MSLYEVASLSKVPSLSTAVLSAIISLSNLSGLIAILPPSSYSIILQCPSIVLCSLLKLKELFSYLCSSYHPTLLICILQLHYQCILCPPDTWRLAHNIILGTLLLVFNAFSILRLLLLILMPKLDSYRFNTNCHGIFFCVYRIPNTSVVNYLFMTIYAISFITKNRH